MSTRKIKTAMVKRVMDSSYRGFMPVEKKIKRDLHSINKAKDTSWLKFNNDN